ncbi:hypothetical protein H2199_006996 [Coniosporium tulheliwenetii]|uniref:Uncharacterized protein n=1 Tax=Coniosporium tulheliwenetii TaxID=3383036 RepID=A0ACC2YSE5_9PEZI|nr:hypothetical protein H2199_006996 [Cladosporium sp. JES 115]
MVLNFRSSLSAASLTAPPSLPPLRRLAAASHRTLETRSAPPCAPPPPPNSAAAMRLDFGRLSDLPWWSWTWTEMGWGMLASIVSLVLVDKVSDWVADHAWLPLFGPYSEGVNDKNFIHSLYRVVLSGGVLTSWPANPRDIDLIQILQTVIMGRNKDPIGQMLSGFTRIRCKTFSVTCSPDIDEADDNGARLDFTIPGRRSSNGSTDFDEQEAAICLSTADRCELICMPVRHMGKDKLEGLILKPSNQEGTYERMGYFKAEARANEFAAKREHILQMLSPIYDLRELRTPLNHITLTSAISSFRTTIFVEEESLAAPQLRLKGPKTASYKVQGTGRADRLIATGLESLLQKYLSLAARSSAERPMAAGSCCRRRVKALWRCYCKPLSLVSTYETKRMDNKYKISFEYLITKDPGYAVESRTRDKKIPNQISTIPPPNPRAHDFHPADSDAQAGRLPRPAALRASSCPNTIFAQYPPYMRVVKVPGPRSGGPIRPQEVLT